MSNLILNTLILSLLLMLALMEHTGRTSKPSLNTQSGSQFLSYFTPRLPANETTVAGKDFTWCSQGHVPYSQYKLQLRL